MAYLFSPSIGFGSAAVVDVLAPQGQVESSGTNLLLHLLAPPAETPHPVTASYTLNGSQHVVCSAIRPPAVCIDHVDSYATARAYTLTTTVGGWVKSRQVEGFTPPPTPTLALAHLDGHSNKLAVVIGSPSGGNPYVVTAFVDGMRVANTPQVVTGAMASTSLALPKLATGRHTLSAVADFRGATASAAPFTFVVEKNGTVVDTAPSTTAGDARDKSVTAPVVGMLADLNGSGTTDSGDLVDVTLAMGLNPTSLCSAWTAGIPSTPAASLEPGSSEGLSLSVTLTPSTSNPTAEVTLTPAAGQCAAGQEGTVVLGTVGAAHVPAGGPSTYDDSRLTRTGDSRQLRIALSVSGSGMPTSNKTTEPLTQSATTSGSSSPPEDTTTTATTPVALP
jgi:hypothetical protein